MEKSLKEILLSQVSEIELVYKSKATSSERPIVEDSHDCYEILKLLWDEGKINLVEEFKVLFLNRANRLIHFYELSSGGITGTVADTRIILAAALKVAACNIVLAHNHPSGNLLPSRADEELTAKIKTAAGYHDIKILDHIILSSESYFSFAEQGLL